ncbi:MAG TPA: isoleucine--tRNA ligase, partial [Thermoplasmata archaeon]|nr:isoleucine--tRNA ligase [Thermoplasmata archaeon]
DFDYKRDFVEFDKRELIDKWILSRMNKLIYEVEEKMEVFEVHKASRLIENFVINDLSNWYIRNSRKRFWTEERSIDKMAGYSTLYEILITLSKIMAPFVPFISEKIYLEMKKGESIHLCSYPESNKKMINNSLEGKMDTVRKIVEEARALRAKNGIKLRYPLKEIIIVSKGEIEELAELIKEEINVKNIIFNADDSIFMEKVVKPNYPKLGPKYKDKAKEVAEIIEKADIDKLDGMKIVLDGIEHVIEKEEFLIEKRAKEGYAIGKIDGVLIALNTKQTPELLAEGFAREIIRRIQEMRKELNLEMEEKISIEIDIERRRIEGWEDYVKNETRSEKIEYKNPECEYVKEWNIDGEKIRIGIKKEN